MPALVAQIAAGARPLEVEVLVTREQNADGMVTISCRALALRKSWISGELCVEMLADFLQIPIQVTLRRHSCPAAGAATGKPWPPDETAAQG